MNDKKLRERTEDELVLQAQGLAEITALISEAGIDYYLCGGTLLGIIRDGDFIKWDWDVGIAVPAEQIYPHRKLLLKNLKNADFNIQSVTRSPVNYKINAIKYGCRYEILAFNLEGSERVRLRSKMPAFFFSEGSTVSLRGFKFRVLHPPEEYLAHYYGDWKTPVKSTKRSVYTSQKSRSPFSIFKWIRNFFGI